MKILTTTDVSKILQVSNRKVTQWIDNGVLKGFRMPGSSHRRVYEDDLKEFMSNSVYSKLLDANGSIIQSSVDVKLSDSISNS